MICTRRSFLLAATLLSTLPALAADVIAPNANLKAEGADNEGHGFARKANADYLFYAMLVFFQERLLQ